MWVGAETDNAPALALYRATGAQDDGEFAMLTWDFTPGDADAPPRDGA